MPFRMSPIGPPGVNHGTLGREQVCPAAIIACLNRILIGQRHKVGVQQSPSFWTVFVQGHRWMIPELQTPMW